MWAIAGVLLGLVAVTALAGFHFGPHAHVVSSVLGATTAVLLIALALTGYAEPLLFTLLGADLAITGGVTVIAARGFADRGEISKMPSDRVEASFGIAVDTLDPTGTVRIQGEAWSATALNPPIPAGTSVHVVRRSSLRLEVWGDTGETSPGLFAIDAGPADHDVLDTTPGPTADAGSGDERKPAE